MERWKTEKSETLLDTPWVKVRRDSVRLPNGATIDDFYAVTIRDASAVVALDEEGNVILKREYRYCYDRELLEIPAGAFNDGETDPLAVARRELLEEAGLRKPWLWQAAEALRPGEASYPMTMEQFTRWRETAG